MKPRVSVVIPAYNEADGIEDVLSRIGEAVQFPCEIVIVVDTPDDSTVPYVEKFARQDPRVRLVVNDKGSGPARAIRCGIEQAVAPVTVVTMADGCDDPQQIDQMARLVERGVVIAAASRYSRGGQQVGGPPLKSALSRFAGFSLWALARVGTRDATNSFKAYDGVRPHRGDCVERRFRNRHRAGRKSKEGKASRCGASNHLARASPGRLQLQVDELAASLPSLVALRLRPGDPRRTSAVSRRIVRSSMSKVLVSGSAGFIGGYVVKELLERKHEVIGLDNYSKYGPVRRSYDDDPNYRLSKARPGTWGF